MGGKQGPSSARRGGTLTRSRGGFPAWAPLRSGIELGGKGFLAARLALGVTREDASPPRTDPREPRGTPGLGRSPPPADSAPGNITDQA